MNQAFMTPAIKPQEKKNSAFIIPAILVIPQILWIIINNLESIFEYTEEIPALKSYSEAFISYINTSALLNIVNIFFSILNIVFIVGCVLKATGGKYKFIIKAFFILEIVQLSISYIISLLANIFYDEYMVEIFSADSRTPLTSTIIQLAIFILSLTFFVILLISEIKESNALRIATIAWYVIVIVINCIALIGIVNNLIMYAKDEQMNETYTKSLITNVVSIASGLSLVIYQLLSLKKKQRVMSVPQPVGYVPVGVPGQLPYQQPVQRPAQPVYSQPVQRPVQPAYQQSVRQTAYTPVQQPGFTAPVQAQAVKGQQTVEERLTKIKALLDNGVITQAEYDEKRAEILKEI